MLKRFWSRLFTLKSWQHFVSLMVLTAIPGEVAGFLGFCLSSCMKSIQKKVCQLSIWNE